MTEVSKEDKHKVLMAGPNGSRQAVLRCIEFWPHAIKVEHRAKDSLFETFSHVVERASQWLCDHHSSRLLNCETAEKKVTQTDQVYGEQLHYLGNTNTAVLVKGLRLWLTVGEQCFDDLHCLKFDDIVPRFIETEYPGPTQYEPINAALDRYNVGLRQKPLPGTIVTVETVCLTIARHKWDGVINTEECRWIDKWQREKFYFLRVFYITGPPSFENIGLADFIPNQLEGTSMMSGRPRFEMFEGVLEQASAWIDAAEEVRITNVQTVESKYCRYKEHEGLKVNSMASFEPKVEMRARIFFVRVAYVRIVRGAGMIVQPGPTPRLNCRTFRPNIVRDSSCCGMMRLHFEGITETTSHVADWLASTNTKPYGVQLLAVPQWYMERGDFQSRMVYNGEYCTEDGTSARLSLMYLLRVYVDGPVSTTTPDHFDLPYEYSCCTVL